MPLVLLYVYTTALNLTSEPFILNLQLFSVSSTDSSASATLLLFLIENNFPSCILHFMVVLLWR